MRRTAFAGSPAGNVIIAGSAERICIFVIRKLMFLIRGCRLASSKFYKGTLGEFFMAEEKNIQESKLEILSMDGKDVSFRFVQPVGPEIRAVAGSMSGFVIDYVDLRYVCPACNSSNGLKYGAQFEYDPSRLADVLGRKLRDEDDSSIEIEIELNNGNESGIEEV